MIYPSQARKETMEKTFAELGKVNDPIIFEVGRMRSEHSGESDGHSTLMFATYIKEKGGRLFSIDNQAPTEAVCREAMAKAGLDSSETTFVNKDAIRFFSDMWSETFLSLLYLDGWDLVNVKDNYSAQNHLLCFLLAEPFVLPGGLVLIDDTGLPNKGKGKLVVPVATLMGWDVLFEGYQTLLRKPK